MTPLEQFARKIDDYVKANEKIQPEDKNLLTIEYNALVQIFTQFNRNTESLERKLRIIKEVLDL